MAQKDHRSKKQKPPRYKDGPGKIAMAAGFFVSGILVTILAFISLQGAAIALGFMALASFILFDMNQRRFWEQATLFKIKTINDNHEHLAREVNRQRIDIVSVRSELEEAVSNIATSQKETLIDETPGKMSLDFDPIPRAISPARPAKEIDPLIDQSILSDTVVRELLHGAVRNKRIDVFVQPIMRLPQRKTRFYEIFARIRAKPGLYLPAARYIEMARRESLMHEIDHLLLMQCLKTIKNTEHIDRAAPFFINVTTSTLGNALFMKQLIGFLARHRTLAPRLVFEIRQQDLDNMQPAILEILRGLGKLGCALSIDHVKNLKFDLKLLQVLKVRFVKIDAKDLIKKTTSDKDFTEMMRLKKGIEGNGIGFIVEKIESEFMLKELLDFEINYGQGYLFGKPDLQAAYKQKAA